MKWFRRKDAPPSPREPQRREERAPSPQPHDWRTYDASDVAEAYARVIAPMTFEPASELLRLANAGHDALVLDVGTGTGNALDAFAGIDIGVDSSEAMLAQGRAQDPARRLAAADVIDLPFRDATFDVVTANFVLPYVRKLDTALFDMIRVLKPGGRIAVSVWTEVLDDLTRAWRTLAEEVLGPELMRDALHQGTPWADKVADADRLDTVLRDAGLRPVRVEKRRYRNELTREDYILGREVEVIGRYLRQMLRGERWEAFRQRVRATFKDRFPDRVVDFRDVLLAAGTKPA